MEAYLYGTNSLDRWRAVIESLPPCCRDIYYWPEYYQTWMDHESADPMCLHMIHNGIDFLYPFFRKTIDGERESQKIYDIFSAYGYGGMIASKPAHAVPTRSLDKVNTYIDQWCAQNGIVAEFVRQNPLFVGPLGPLRRADNTVVRYNVYRTYDKDQTLRSASARRNIRKAKKHGLKIVFDRKMNSVDDFNRLYTETARRINMHPYYLFGEAYTDAVARLMRNVAMFVNVVLETNIIASAMIFKQGHFTTYHLSGSATRCRKLYPNELLLAALIELADGGPMSVLSFGGGLTCAVDDPLFEFKNRFGNDARPVTIGKNLHDSRRYHRLCTKWEQQYPQLKDKYQNYFLKYRLVQ